MRRGKEDDEIISGKGMSPDEIQVMRELEAAGRQLDESLKKIGFTSEDFIEDAKTAKEDASKMKDLGYSFDKRGEKFYTNEEIHKNYKEALPIFKWTTLPFCKRTVKRKSMFWIACSPLLGLTLGQYRIMRSQGKIKSLPPKTYLIYMASFAVFGCIYSLAESLMFDDYCNINSYHYSLDTDRLSMSRKIKESFNAETARTVKKKSADS